MSLVWTTVGGYDVRGRLIKGGPMSITIRSCYGGIEGIS